MFNQSIDGLLVKKKFHIEDTDTLLFFVGWLYHFSGLKEVIRGIAQCNRERILNF